MQPLLLLHGALGASAQFASLSLDLAASFTVYTLNFSGHGGRPIPKDGFQIDTFVADTLAYLDEMGLEKVDIFGYSMGGYVALSLAQTYPDRVGKIYTLGTKFAWTPDSAAKESKMLNPDLILEKVPKFADILEQRHAPTAWQEVLQHTATMMLRLGEAPLLTEEALQTIKHKTLISVGDQDEVVSRDESMRASKHLPNAEFACMAETPHPLEKVDKDRLCQWITNFFG